MANPGGAERCSLWRTNESLLQRRLLLLLLHCRYFSSINREEFCACSSHHHSTNAPHRPIHHTYLHIHTTHYTLHIVRSLTTKNLPIVPFVPLTCCYMSGSSQLNQTFTAILRPVAASASLLTECSHNAGMYKQWPASTT